MLAQGFVDLFFDAAPHLEYIFQFFELNTKAAFAKAAFDTLRKVTFGLPVKVIRKVAFPREKVTF